MTGPDGAPARTGRADPGPLGGAVRLEAVSFRYPGAAAKALDAVSLHAAPGEMIAVVGPSGAGKSTLVRVLLGFEHPDSGSVRYDGQDLAGLDVRLVRRQLGTVLQNGKLLRGSLLENLAGTDPDVSERDVWDAAELAGIADDLRRLPLGLGTRVGEDARASPAARSNGCCWPAPWCGAPPYSCWTRPPRPWTTPPSGTWPTASPRWTAPGWSSPTASAPFAPPTGSTSSTAAGWRPRARTTPCSLRPTVHPPRPPPGAVR